MMVLMKNKILKQLAEAYLSGQDYVSGADMARDLGVSRMAVSKAIQSLVASGLPIESTRHHGYRLAIFPDLLLGPLIEADFERISWQGFSPDLHAFASVDSTNLAARRGSDQGDPAGSVYVAEEQTAGRGRRGKSWRSAAGEGLWFSLLLQPDLPPEQLAPVTLFAGLCAATALRKAIGLDIQLKWPNDLVILPAGRKIGGILTEMLVEENQIAAVIIGLGINVHTLDFPADLQALATSLALELARRDNSPQSGTCFQSSASFPPGTSFPPGQTNPVLNRIGLLTAILGEWDRRWPQFLAQASAGLALLPEAGWLDDYRAICATLGRPVVVHDASGQAWEGLALDLAPGGDLRVQRADGSISTVSAGDVSVRGFLGYV